MSSIADLRVDPAGKGAAFLGTGLLHAAVLAALLGSASAPRVLEVGFTSFEVVDLAPNEVEAVPEPPPPPPEPVAEPEPEPEPVVEPEPEPLPIPEPEPIPEPPPEPEEAALDPEPAPTMAPPPRKPMPPRKPKPEPVAEPKPQPQPTPQPKPVERPPEKVAKKAPVAPAEPVYVPPSARAAYLRNPKPAYPSLARKRGWQGLVLLGVLVAAKGHALEVLVKKSSGHGILDKAAVKAVRTWRFVPATRGGRAVRARLEVPIRFSLNDA